MISYNGIKKENGNLKRYILWILVARPSNIFVVFMLYGYWWRGHRAYLPYLDYMGVGGEVIGHICHLYYMDIGGEAIGHILPNKLS